MAGAFGNGSADWQCNTNSPNIDENRQNSYPAGFLHPLNYTAYKLEDIRFRQEHSFHNPAIDFQQGIAQLTSFLNAASATKFGADIKVNCEEDRT